MSFELIAGAGAEWIWGKYGQDLTDKALGQIKRKWQQFKWKEAESEYRSRLYQQHSTTRIFGHFKQISIEDIYTDVYVLDKPAAFRWFDINKFQGIPLERDHLKVQDKRKPALRLLVNRKRLFILGKPGSGKTTLLRYLTLQACLGTIQKTPIFIGLQEWVSTQLDLMEYLIQQFALCGFPDARAFIERLLDAGDAIVFFDGLDEVSRSNGLQKRVISEIVNFAKRYPEINICVSCRVAGTEYSFEHFTYLEIADFDERQVRLFVTKWYSNNPSILGRFLGELSQPGLYGLRELTRTPLLLALLCLVFDERLTFPDPPGDIYKEAFNVMLRKWDSSRGVRRDGIYGNLSIGERVQLLSHLAYVNFLHNNYFMKTETLSSQIVQYFGELGKNIGSSEGEMVLQAIESQHGIIVERAQGIYSFSHLSFQEYLTANYIVRNLSNEETEHLIKSHLSDFQWREIFLLSAGLYDEADAFLKSILQEVSNIIIEDDTCKSMLRWVMEMEQKSKARGPAIRAIWLVVALDKAVKHAAERHRAFFRAAARDLDLDRAVALAQSIFVDLDNACARAYAMANQLLENDELKKSAMSYARSLAYNETGVKILSKELGTNHSTVDQNVTWRLGQFQTERIMKYIQANELFLECLGSAVVSKRNEIARSQFTLC